MADLLTNQTELILKLLFLKFLYDLSDREVISRCQTDMAFKFFLGLNPEDEVPDASLLAKFRTLRITEDGLQEFLNETVRQAIDHKVIKSKTIIVDSTHSRSKHTPQTPTQILREMTKNLRKEIHRTQNEICNVFPEKPTVEDDIFEDQRNFETTEHFKQIHKIRWKIEQRNSHLKNQYGLNINYGTGLWSMKAQSFLTAITANIVKITKLVATV